MEHSEKTVVYEFINNDYVRDRRTAAHKKSNIRMSENALHDDLILNFC